MWLKSLLRSVTVFTLLSCAPYAAAQDVRDETGSSSNRGDIAAMQYYVLFRQLVHPPVLRNPTAPTPPDQNNRTSPPQIDYRAMLHRTMKLSDTEARVLDQIAEDCIGRTDKLDQQAREIITAHRADVRAGKIPPTDPPPAALLDLQKQRDGAIQNAVEQLRAQFGEAEFKRLYDYLTHHSDVSSVRLPPPSQKALPVQVKFALVNGDGSSPARFTARDSFTIEVSMLNNSTEMISIRPSELYQWLLLTKAGEPDDPRRPPRNLLFSDAWLHPPADEAAVDLPPNQLQVISQFRFGAGGIRIMSPPGEYQLTVHPRVVYARPEKTDFLQLSLESPFQFEIGP